MTEKAIAQSPLEQGTLLILLVFLSIESEFITDRNDLSLETHLSGRESTLHLSLSICITGVEEVVLCSHRKSMAEDCA